MAESGFRNLTLGPQTALPDAALYDSLMSFQKIQQATNIPKDAADTGMGKLQIHMAKLAQRESLWLLAAFELMYDRPELAIMLGGTGLAQVNALANMLKQEGDRAYAKGMFAEGAAKVMGALGPLGMGEGIFINHRGAGSLYNPLKESSVESRYSGLFGKLKYVSDTVGMTAAKGGNSSGGQWPNDIWSK